MPFPRSAGGAPPMATQEDIDRIAQMAERTEDVAQLRQYRQELLSIAANMATVIAQTSDSGVQEHAGEIKQSAEYGADEIGERARQLEIDQMDPDYERRKAEAGAGTVPGAAPSETPPIPPPQPPPSPTPQPPPIPAPQPGGNGAVATMACKSCGAQVKGWAKFCPECGTPTAA